MIMAMQMINGEWDTKLSRKITRKSNYYQFERKMMQKMLSLILISIGMVLFFRELIRGKTAELGLYTGYELQGAEGLGDVVVCSQGETKKK